MPKTTQLAQRISKSPTIAMNDQANQLAAEGHAVIGLAGGEPDFDTPEHIVEAGIRALRDGETSYATPAKGIKPLLEAISMKMERDSQVRVNPMTDIVVTPGGKMALFLALKAMLDPGDEVLIPAPYWVSYPSVTTMVGGTWRACSIRKPPLQRRPLRSMQPSPRSMARRTALPSCGSLIKTAATLW